MWLLRQLAKYASAHPTGHAFREKVSSFSVQAVRARPGNPQQKAFEKPESASDTDVQPVNQEKSPARATADKHRPNSPDYKLMFRFEGHFDAQNNPNLPDSQQQAEPHQQAASMHTHVEKSNDMPSNASVIPAEGSQQTQSIEYVGVSCAKPAVGQAQAPQRPASEFRRSHSPEFYNAKFERYVLR